MANQDKDKLAGAEHGVGDQPVQADGAVSTGEGPASGQGDAEARGAGGNQHVPDAAGRSGLAEDDGTRGDGPAARGEDGGPAGESGAAAAPLDPRLAHRPAGFAGGFLQRDPPAYPGAPAGDEPADSGGEGAGYGPGDGAAGSVWMPRESAESSVQSSPYAPYGGYDPYPAQGQEDYGQYGQPHGYAADQGYEAVGGYGADQGYGAERGYGQGQGYAAQEGYAQAYPQPPEYGEGRGYGAAETYGEDQRYGDDAPYGQDGPYGGGQEHGPAQAYPPGQPYGGQAYTGQPPSSYAQGYAQAPAGAQTQGGDQDRAEAHSQAGGQQPGSAQAQAGAPGSPAGQAREQAPGREQGAGNAAPYPPRDNYRWQSPYEAVIPSGPPQGGRAPFDVPGYPGQGRGRGEGDPAARPYGETTYPPPGAPQRAAPQPGRADTLAPLPGHGAEQQQVAETADDLTAEALLHGKRQAPGGGWRRLLYKGSGGLIHPRESAEAVRRRELIARVRTPVAGGHHRVAVMSLKGGVGKTTTCVSLGSMLASLRGDRIIALDANPDRGTLSDKVRLETAATVRDLLNERDQIQRYADVRAFTSQAPSRLEVLASDRDPAVSIAFSEEDYYDAARVLEHYYSISLTDCGTGLLHSAMAGVLRMADQIVLVSSPSVDGARSASATLDWLDAHEYGDLVRNAVVVLSMVRPRSKSSVDLDRLEHHFASRCRAVARIPYDAHLEEGAEVDLEQLSPATVNAYLVLAATVGDGFAWPRPVARQPALAGSRDRRVAGNHRSARNGTVSR